MITKKLLSATFLVAGTAIGAGTIALPMVLAKVGLLGSCLLMFITWLIGYYSALMGIELNLRAKEGMPIGPLAQRFSGPTAHLIGTLSLLFLCYGLSCAYISGSGSVLANISGYFDYGLSTQSWSSIVSIMLFIILLYGVNVVLHVNRYIFWMLLGGFTVMVLWLALQTPWTAVRLPDQYHHFSSWSVAIPVLLTSFGFQVIFHTLYSYLDGDKILLKKAFFWGSLIPVGVYMAWTFSILLYIAHHDPHFYELLVTSSISVGKLTAKLGEMMHTPKAQFLVWVITLFAILTSLLGVGIALMDQIREAAKKYAPHKGIIALLAIIPPYLVSTYIPEAFIKALGFAGMVLSVLAILLPGYLLFQSDKVSEQAYYPVLGCKSLRIVVIFFGISIILLELINMMKLS